jgi:hypothetical protein
MPEWPPGPGSRHDAFVSTPHSFPSLLGPIPSSSAPSTTLSQSRTPSVLLDSACSPLQPPGQVSRPTRSFRRRRRSPCIWGLLGCCGHRLARPFRRPARLARLELYLVSLLDFCAPKVRRRVLTRSAASSAALCRPRHLLTLPMRPLRRQYVRRRSSQHLASPPRARRSGVRSAVSRVRLAWVVETLGDPQVRPRRPSRCADLFRRLLSSIAHTPSRFLSPASSRSPPRPARLGTSLRPSRRSLCPRFRAWRIRFARPRSRPLARPGHPWARVSRRTACRVVRRASQLDVLRRRPRPRPPRHFSTHSPPLSRHSPHPFAPSCPWACRVALWARLDDARRRPSCPQGPLTVWLGSSTCHRHLGGRATHSVRSR